MFGVDPYTIILDGDAYTYIMIYNLDSRIIHIYPSFEIGFDYFVFIDRRINHTKNNFLLIIVDPPNHSRIPTPP